MFKCDCCGGDTHLVYFLRTEEAAQKMDKGEYCKKCFDIKFKEKQDDKDK